MAEDPWAEFLGTSAPATTPHDPWAEFVVPAGKQEGDVASDLLPSAGIGLAKGVTSIPGFAGDLQALAAKYGPAAYIGSKLQEHFPEAAERLHKYVAEKEQQLGNATKGTAFELPAHVLEKFASPTPGFPIAPTSGDIQGAIEKNITGPWYEPKTKWGERVENVASFIPQALTGGESIPANIVKGAIIPGAASQAAGEAVQGTWAEPWARIAGGIGGAGAAHAAQAGAAAARAAGTARSAAGDVGNLIGEQVTPGAVTRMAKDVRNDQLTPATASARMAELGPEAMMLDAGRQLQGRAEAIATQPGAGQNRVLNAVENRTGQFGDATAQRIKATLDHAMGTSPDVVATRDAVGRIVDSYATPLYQRVMAAHPIVDVPPQITERPAVAQAMRDAESLARNYGETISGAQPSLQYWDYVKKALDSRVNGMMRSGGIDTLDSRQKADLGGLINARNALRDHLDTITGGEYANARRVAATKPELNEALQQGQEALRTKMLPEELREVYGNMSMPQQTMMQAGMRREIERLIDTARNDGAAARRILDTNQNREKIATMFGQPSADAIDRRIAAETHFQQATESIARNSRTGVRQQLVKDTESPSVSAPPVANLMGYATKGIMNARQSMADLANERTRAALGAMSTTPGHQVPDLVRILSGYNQAAARHATPPISPLAKTLARVGTIRAVNNAAQQQQQSP